MKLWIVSVVIPLVLTLGFVPVTWQGEDAVDPQPIVVEHERLEAPVYHPPSVTLGDASKYSPPDFSAYTDLADRKEAFFDYLLPKIYKSNHEIMLERQWLLVLRDKILQAQSLSEQELEEMAAFEARYRLRPAETSSVVNRLGKLLVRVDVVPASLVVAQAAKESGWGTSRFARKGNNFFGIWCFYKGCGIKPLRRREGLTHEVATFASVEEGVRYYMRTINSHRAYKDLRKMRATARRQSQAFAGEQLAVGLVHYSERGFDYVKEIQSMIRLNELYRFTRQHEEVPGSA